MCVTDILAVKTRSIFILFCPGTHEVFTEQYHPGSALKGWGHLVSGRNNDKGQVQEETYKVQGWATAREFWLEGRKAVF